MEVKKTLWMLEIGDRRMGRLVPIYAVDETEAWIEAARWALENSVSIPKSATLIHFPHGFTIHRRVLPGTVHEECI